MKKLEEFPDYYITENAKIISKRCNTPKILKQCIDKFGYYCVSMRSKNNKTKTQRVHSLMMSSYGQSPPIDMIYPTVDHIDGNKLNNRADNLEWCTQQENVHHAMDTGLRRTEVINEYRAISDETATQICILLEQGSRNKDICEMFGVTQVIVSGIKAGKFYRDISQDFNFRNVPSSNRISESKVIGICEKLQDGESVNKIRLSYGVAFSVVKNIKDRKTYTYLSNNYNW